MAFELVTLKHKHLSQKSGFCCISSFIFIPLIETEDLVDRTETTEQERNKGYKVNFKQICDFIIITNENACYLFLVQDLASLASKTVSAADTTLIVTYFLRYKRIERENERNY